MGKRQKNKVRAQRKFAQGAYVPQQSTPSAAPTQVTVNANHRAVRSWGPVTKNMCSAMDLLTRMSLKSAHNHTVTWPIVLVQDCLKTYNINPDKKKVGVKKRHSPRILRSMLKQDLDVANRNSSESDSGEDRPLSHLRNSAPSKQVKNLPDGEREGTTSRTTSNDNANPTSAQLAPKQRTNGATQIKRTCFKRKKRSLNLRSNPGSSSCKSNLLPSSPEPDDQNNQHPGPRTRSSTKNGPTSSTGSDNTTSSRIWSSCHCETDQPPTKRKLLKIRAAMKNQMPKNLNELQQILTHSDPNSLLTAVRFTRATRLPGTIKERKISKKQSKAVQSNKTSTPVLCGERVVQDEGTQTEENDQEMSGCLAEQLNQGTEYMVQSTDEDSNQDDNTTMIPSPRICNIVSLNEDFKMDVDKYSPTNEDIASIQPEADTADLSSDSLPVLSVPARFMNDLNSCNTSEITELDSLTYDLDVASIKPDADTSDAESLYSFTAPFMPARFTNDRNSCNTSEATKESSPSNDFDMASVKPDADTIETSSDSSLVPSVPARFTKDRNLCNTSEATKENSPSNDFDTASVKPEADTIDTSSDSSVVPSVPARFTKDSNSCNTSEATKENFPSNDFDMASVQPEADTIETSSDSSVVPSVPARFTKDRNSSNTSQVTKVNSPSKDHASIKPVVDTIDLTISDSLIVPSAPAQCPLQSIDDLHALLGSEVACKTCRRCTLINMYEKISINLPLGRNDDPFFQGKKIPPNPATDRSSRNRKREKVCKVLTSRRLPLWLINFHMKLHKDVFENENYKGTLKRTLALNPEDDEDALVCDIIGRLEYLKKCIIEDNIELYLDRPLPSPTRSMNEYMPCNDIEEVEEPILVYRPTLDEFKDPILYINSIRKSASKYGMCKIIPPEGFHVPYRLDENCVFGTTNQHLGRLFHRWGPNTKEFATIQTTMTSLRTDNKEQFIKAPLFCGMELDLVKFYHFILEEGGIQALFSHEEKWAIVAKKMELVYPSSKLVWRKLEKIYCKHVLPYESLTADERKAVTENVERIWEIRSKNTSLRAAQPLQYHHAMLGLSALDDYEEANLPGELSFLHNLCKPIYDKIEECIGKGRSMNLAKFREIAGTFQGMRFPKGLPSTIAAIEQNYWNILNVRKEHVCVLSAFIDTYVNSLGHESDREKPGGSHPWNLKRIGENPNNILHSLGQALCVTVPTLCVNQLFSTNCWHKDPHKLAWMDYMHEGATKIWYSVPNIGAPALRRAVQNMTVAAVQEKKIWLASDTTMIPPGHLHAYGVPFQRIEQNPNEFIVVFPSSYASSISTGFSVSESIYFENNQWLDNVEQVIEEMHKDCEPAMFSSILLLMKMAKNPRLDADVLKQANSILRKIITTEIEARREARRLNCRITTVTQGREECHLMPTAWPNQEECCVCRLPLVLSKMTQYDQPRKLMCVVHGTELMSSFNMRLRRQRPPEMPLVTLRYTEEELLEIIDTSVSS